MVTGVFLLSKNGFQIALLHLHLFFEIGFYSLVGRSIPSETDFKHVLHLFFEAFEWLSLQDVSLPVARLLSRS